MKRIHLLRVDFDSDIEDFRSLIDAVRADGGRVGWLVWRPEDPAENQRPDTAGLLRHVEVDASGSVARKARAGPAVLRDVIREHLRGCRVVLVEGELAELPRISMLKDRRFRVESDGTVRQGSAAELAAWLRRPGF